MLIHREMVIMQRRMHCCGGCENKQIRSYGVA